MKWAYSEPGDGREERPDHERQQPGVHDPDADRLGRDAVLALGEHLAPVRGALDAPHDVDHEQHPGARPPQVRVRRDVRERPRAAGIGVRVEQHHPDDHQEPEGRDGDEVARQPHQHAADQPGDHADQRGGDQRRGEEPRGDGADDLVEVHAGEPGRQVGQVRRLLLERQREDRRRVGAQGHEPDLAQREHPGEAAGQVQADRQDDEDPEVDREPLPERLAAGVEDRQRDRRQRDHQQRAGRAAPMAHRRSPCSRLPRIPCGRTSRTRMRMTNTMASR